MKLKVIDTTTNWRANIEEIVLTEDWAVEFRDYCKPRTMARKLAWVFDEDLNIGIEGFGRSVWQHGDRLRAEEDS